VVVGVRKRKVCNEKGNLRERRRGKKEVNQSKHEAAFKIKGRFVILHKVHFN